ncbi:MAG: helix-turn-helix transcriptional regulator, partial [Bifidobacterium sp.]|uniref:helix-turn-helix domain-containing protein n=1 Tax=Bifidobacterium sp. TaxID=41200 RepID=UPI00284C2E91
MTAVETMSAVNMNAHADYMEKVVAFNIGLMLSKRKGKSQTGLAKVLGVKPQTVSAMIARQTCSFRQFIMAAEYLETTPEQLMDDTVMQMVLGDEMQENRKATGDTPMASNNKLLRLGLNQRPSD